MLRDRPRRELQHFCSLINELWSSLGTLNRWQNDLPPPNPDGSLGFNHVVDSEERLRVSVISRVARKISGQDNPWWKAGFRWVMFLGVAGVVTGAITFFALYRLIGIPDPNADFQTQTTNVYYSDGTHKIGSFATQDRRSISLNQIPASMQAAAVAAEDRSFYTNRGIDIKGILRAVRSNATSGQIQAGGSTITQQYVKILYLTQDRTITRKVKEAILSIKIHNQLSKSEILEGYLNTIYFGNGSYGVEVASQTYFAHPASKLTVPESATLAAIINSPGYYDPYVDGGPARLVNRYNYVLNGMAKDGTIDASQLAKYRDNLPKFAKKKDNNRYAGSKGFLLKQVQLELDKRAFTPSQISGGGYKIVTTFDYKAQKAAVAAVKAIRPPGFKDVHTALVSIQPGTGAVRAMYGGPDYLKSQLNWATIGSQPGSAFKPFAVVAALEDGYSLRTMLQGNSPIRLPNGDEVENQGENAGVSYGRVPLSKATALSINTAFVDLTEQMTDGPAKIKAAAAAAGIPKSVLKNYPEVPVTSLGIERVPTVDMANAFATLAANGKRSQWYVVQSVKDTQGAVLYKHKSSSEQTIPKDVAADTVSDLEGVVRGGTGTNGRTICPTAGKTGTATAGEGQSQHVSSSWFVGFTPKLATAVMYNRGAGLGRLDGYLPTYFGGQYPAKTFREYMNSALAGTDCGTFPPAANIRSTKGQAYTPAAPKPKPKPKPKPTETTPVPTPATPVPTTPVPTEPPATDPTAPPTAPPTANSDNKKPGGVFG